MAEITIPNQTTVNSGYDNVPQGGVIQNTSAYRDVRKLNIYEFMEHTYCGDHGYRDCSYLTPAARETFYEDRRKESYYVNALKPIINAMVDPCFSDEITRTTNNSIFEQFIANCDAAGTTLTKFMHNAIKKARLYSVNFIVMENYDAKKQADSETQEQVISDRVFPYIYEKEPDDVPDWGLETDKHGRLISITFCDEEVEIDGKEVESYRRWNSNAWETFYLKNVDGKQVAVNLDSGIHGLGIIPVVAITNFATSSSLKELPDPELYDIAFLCFGLFNKESNVRWMEVMQTFAILCTSGMGNNAKAIGPATFLDSGTDSKYPPQYVAPPQDGIRTLIDNCERLKSEIKDQAKQKGVIGVKQAASGIAKEWDFRAEEQVLKQTSAAAVAVEQVLAMIFGAYIKSDVTLESEYPMEFSPAADQMKITDGLAIVKEAPPAPVEAAVWKEITQIYFKGNDEIIKEVSEAIDVSMAEKAVLNDMMTQQIVPEETIE